MKKDLTNSLETYLHAIYELLENKEQIIVKDIAEYLHFGGASTANAIKKLKVKGYVNYEPYGNVTLTELGKKTIIVKNYRHNTITTFLTNVLNVDVNIAKYNAEQMEYYMTDDVLSRLVNFLDFMEQCFCKVYWRKRPAPFGATGCFKLTGFTCV